jgi:hypothetical protein
MLTVEMLPACEGDCLILRWGTEAKSHRILFDGGRKSTHAALRKLSESLTPAERRFELLVVTHVDRDHIEGALELLDDCPLDFADVWFNGFQHLAEPGVEELGAVQGERLTERLVELCGRRRWSWNGRFGEHHREPAALRSDGSLPRFEFPGDLTLTLLSPTRERLRELRPHWEKECRKAGIVAGQAASAPDREGVESLGAIDIEELAEARFEEDDSEPNGSSIAVLAEYRQRRVLLAADAFPGDLEAALAKLSALPFELDAFKLPHHGSRKNVSKALLQAIRCPRYLFSTSGAYFGHPDPVAVSRVIRWGGADSQLWFNYLSDETRLWDTQSWKDRYGYSTHYPDERRNGHQLVVLEP